MGRATVSALRAAAELLEVAGLRSGERLPARARMPVVQAGCEGGAQMTIPIDEALQSEPKEQRELVCEGFVWQWLPHRRVWVTGNEHVHMVAWRDTDGVWEGQTVLHRGPQPVSCLLVYRAFYLEQLLHTLVSVWRIFEDSESDE